MCALLIVVGSCSFLWISVCRPLTSFLICGLSPHAGAYAGTGGGRGRGGGSPRHLRGQRRGQPRRAVPPGEGGAAHVRPQGRRRGVSIHSFIGWLLWLVGGWVSIPSCVGGPNSRYHIKQNNIQGAGPHRGGGWLRPAEPRARCVISAWLGGWTHCITDTIIIAPLRTGHTQIHTRTHTNHTCK